MASEHEKKMIEMQLQLRENQSYMSDCFKDLENWSTEMKEKESKLINSEKTKEKELPPVRSLATVKKKKKVQKPEKTENDSSKATKKAQKIKGYDYRSWDKLDVDALCEKVDDEQIDSSSDYTTDEEWENEQRKSRANWEKERGNLFYKDNLIDDAINCYTRAIDLDPTNYVLPANRAMCLLKQEKYGAAELDCTLTIHLNDKYAKAYHRRGTARFHLGKLEEAAKDFEQVLKLEPNNKAVQEELKKIENLIESRSLVFPINKTVDQRSKKPLKRIEIIEINSDVNEKTQSAIKEINSKIKLNANDEKLFDLTNKKEEKNKIEIIENKENVDVHKKELTVTKKIEQIPPTPIQKNIEKPKVIPTTPANSYQFRKDWQLLSGNIDDLSIYFKVNTLLLDINKNTF